MSQWQIFNAKVGSKFCQTQIKHSNVCQRLLKCRSIWQNYTKSGHTGPRIISRLQAHNTVVLFFLLKSSSRPRGHLALNGKMTPNLQLEMAGSKQPPWLMRPGRQQERFFNFGQAWPKQQMKWAKINDAIKLFLLYPNSLNIILGFWCRLRSTYGQG